MENLSAKLGKNHSYIIFELEQENLSDVKAKAKRHYRLYSYRNMTPVVMKSAS